MGEQEILDFSAISYTINGLGTIISLHEEFCTFFGYAENDLVDQHFSALHEDFHGPLFFSDLLAQLKKRERWQGEIYTKAKDGQHYKSNIEISSEPNSANNYTISFLNPGKNFGVSLPGDFTELVLESISNAHLIIDESFKIVACNKLFKEAIKEFYGITLYPNQVLNQLNLNGAENKVYCMALKCFEGQSMSSEAELALKNGQKHWFRVAVHPIYINNTVSFISIDIVDINDKKRALESLREERKLFTGGPTVIFKWLAQEEWPVAYVSPNVHAVFGYHQEDFISGKITYANIIHPEDLSYVHDDVKRHLAEDAEQFEQEYRVITADGKIIWLHDFTLVTKNTHGEILYLYGYVQDVTERKTFEDKIIHQNKNLSEIIRIQAHELRGPLTVVQGLTELFDADNVENPINKEVIQNIKSPIDELDKVIKKVVRKAESLL